MTEIDTTDCENEPIRLPGAAMPHGALFVLSERDRTIEAVSESCTDILGLRPDQLVGHAFDDVMEAAAVDRLSVGPSSVRPPCELSLNGRALAARANENASGQIVVDVEPEDANRATHEDLLYSLRRGLAGLRNLSDLPTIFQAAAELMRNVTGYDRVLMYRFDPAWNGEVVAEARSPEVKSYFGHHFPASDIPKQVRDLSLISGPRMIVDVDYKPSPLFGAGDSHAYDLGLSSLRSVSPIHIQFMKNMGVQASLIGSLVVDGALWGHLSCHHESGPKYLGPSARDAFGWACEDIAALIGATQTRTLRAREHELAMLRQNLVQKIRSGGFESLMSDPDSQDLLAVVGADGFALVTGDQVQILGSTPSAHEIARLQTAWRERASDHNFFASSALARDLGESGAIDGIAGAIIVLAPQFPDVALVWFRRERRYNVRWGGDPNHAHLTGADGRLTPRTSFDLFLQEIAGQSLEWSPEERVSAKELASLIEIELLRKEAANRKIREEQLSASEERFRMLIEEAPDAILLYDYDQDRIVATNKAAERLFGVSRDGLLQPSPQAFGAVEEATAPPTAQSFLQRFYIPGPGDAAPLSQALPKILERVLAGEEVVLERRIRRPSGEVRVARATLVQLPSSIRLLRASLVDVTEQDRAQRELAWTAAILAAEHETSPDGILVIDRAARILSVNRRYSEIFDIPAELLAARDDRPVLALAAQQVQDTDEFLRQAQYHRDHPDESVHDEFALKDGRIIDRFTSPFKLPDGEYLGRIFFFRDITERQMTEESLRASEERFRMLIEEAPDAILLYDCDQDRYIATNKAAERLFGVPRRELLENGPRPFYAPQQPDGRPADVSFSQHTARALAGEEVTFERRVRRPSGEERVCLATLVRLPSDIRVLRASLLDVTEQRAAEAQLSEILRSTVGRQEAERQRIARDLHDSLSQYLAASNMRLEIFSQLAGNNSRLRSVISELKGLMGAVGDEVARLAWELRPIALDDIGLEPAVRHLAEEWTMRSGLRFDLHLALKGLRLRPDVEISFYRILQEAITNIVKHADARKVGVVLETSSDCVVMLIEDDGKGFNLEDVNPGSSPRFGLLGIRERLTLIDGTLEVETGPGAGTTLLIRAPIGLARR